MAHCQGQSHVSKPIIFTYQIYPSILCREKNKVTTNERKQFVTFHGMLAFQHLQASLRCWRITRALFCLMPSGIMSRMSCITAALSSKSKWLSTRCLVTVFATPLECRPSNCLAKRLPSQRSKSGTTPRKKKSHTLQPGAQNPHPGPFPTGPCKKGAWLSSVLVFCISAVEPC